MLCCLIVQLQGLDIGVTTKHPQSGSLPQNWYDIYRSDQYWYILIRGGDCVAQHKSQRRVLQWNLDRSAGNTLGCCVLQTGELHLYHNGRDVGVALKGLPIDQPLWGFVILFGGWKVEANYVIPKGEAVTCGEVVCGVMFVSLNICTCYCHFLYFALHMAVVKHVAVSVLAKETLTSSPVQHVNRGLPLNCLKLDRSLSRKRSRFQVIPDAEQDIMRKDTHQRKWKQVPN